jgi:hypothetical protein
LDPSETGGYLSAEGGRRAAGASAAAAGEAASGTGGRGRATSGEIPVQLGTPILRAPDVLRVWLAPWTDEQDRLHEASYVYVQAAPPEWAYTGPRRSGARSDRFGTPIVPRPPADAGTARAPAGAPGSSPSTGPAAARPTPAAAGVLPSGSAAASASSSAAGAKTAAPGSAPSGQVLMVPTPQGGQRPVVIPQVGAPAQPY